MTRFRSLHNSPSNYSIYVNAQARGGLVAKLRRRASQLKNRRARLAAGENGVRETAGGISYVADRELWYRSEFNRNDYLPGLPYYRFDNDMPGVTRADRFRGRYHGYQNDYYGARF